MRILSVVTVVATAAFVAAGIAGAADDKPTAPVQAASETNAEPLETQVGSIAQVYGKVISIHNCAIVGTSDTHVLVKLESSPGNVEIVDLGSTAALKSNGIEPHQGQQFWVNGQVGKINDKPLVVAETISESKLITIDRQPLREETTKHADARQADAAAGSKSDAPDVKKGAPKTETADAGQQTQTIEGSVVNTRHVKIEGESTEHILAKVQTESGLVVLDLGSSATMPNTVDLTAGKSIAATGILGHLNSKPIILAETVGNMSSIQRSDEAAGAIRTSVPTTDKK